ncbi:MAG: Glutamyl-tRNA(Gln) amidotransferase subunit A [uncultured bacterium (gcode 4)]|uniref:Glutamyl-tRNA(Gln) amidotransferase subunit A n=1 Tax=uncultured bacterium (gcode 4) TaxID=1234023 RepID=K2GHP1_9BACT|nr:MAG: Glutamyl-tRNA(Gln) amidotransferase subunit A [uncultured bacterium (gcode 4)]
MEFKDLSLKEIIAKIKDGTTTQNEVYRYFLGRIDEVNPQIEAFNTINRECNDVSATSELAGAPIWVKDLFCEKWIRTTASSKMLENFVPPYNSTVIDNLICAWMSSIWKLNLDEFAMGWSWENSALRITKNPWDPTRIPGWSSSWSAAAVASGMVPASLGTDTGWSIRQPASMCWVVWFKPTYWRNSRFWIIAMASSLDTPGTFTKTVEDAAILYGIMSSHDEKDSTSLSSPNAINPEIWKKEDLKWVRVWVPKEYFIDWIEEWVKREMEKAIWEMKELWAEIVDISLPHTEFWLAVYYIVMPAEVSTNLSRYDGVRYGYANDTWLDINELLKKNRWEWFWKEAQRRIMLGSFVLSSGFYDAYYKKAALVRKLINKDFDEAFKKVDVIITPTAPSVAWKIWEKADDPLKMYLADIFTVNWSLAHLPGISIPVGYAKPEDWEDVDLPVWMQILWPKMWEEKVFEVANVIEKKLKSYIDSKKPKVF